MMNARDWERAASELARPRSLSSVRRLTSGLTVGASTVSPSPNSAVKPNTKAIRPVAATGSAARPNTAQEAARISPLMASALLRRARRTRRTHEQLGEHHEGGVDGERQGYDTRRHVRFD